MATINKTKAWDKFQQFVLDNYAMMEFIGIPPKNMAEAKKCGDSLMPFLLTELSEDEGCDNWDTFRQRLETVVRDLQELIVKSPCDEEEK